MILSFVLEGLSYCRLQYLFCVNGEFDKYWSTRVWALFIPVVLAPIVAYSERFVLISSMLSVRMANTFPSSPSAICHFCCFSLWLYNNKYIFQTTIITQLLLLILILYIVLNNTYAVTLSIRLFFRPKNLSHRQILDIFSGNKVSVFCYK